MAGHLSPAAEELYTLFLSSRFYYLTTNIRFITCQKRYNIGRSIQQDKSKFVISFSSEMCKASPAFPPHKCWLF